MRERIREIAARAEPHRASAPPTRDDLHALLDACLDLAALHETTPKSLAWEAAEAARPIAAALARGAFGWTEPPGPDAVLPLPDGGAAAWHQLERAPRLWRDEALARLARAPHVLPGPLVDALRAALRALNAGSGAVPPLLRPWRSEGRGTNPAEARFLEEQFWMWIAYERGAKRRTVDAARLEVATATGVSTDAVDKWRAQWRERAGKTVVDKCLAEWQARGAAGRPFLPGWGLEDAARQWRAARAPRTG